MMYKPVPLVRYFSLVPRSKADSDEQELRSIWGNRKRTGWQEIEEEFRCVILAEAGAGKSFEMETRARHAEKLGRAAFFIRIEDIEEDFESAFEVGRADTFENWLNSQEEAWFFLDSIDEARLENPRAFEKAIKRFAKRIKPATQRARVFISSRPYAWRARSDRDLLERHLPFNKLIPEAVDGGDYISEEIDAGQPSEPESALRVYLLDPLGEDGIRTFANHRDTPLVDRLIVDLDRANMMAMAARPFDLEGILAKWKTDQTLDGRLALLQHNIDLRLSEIDPNRAQRQPLNREKARRGACVLAAAVILTGEPGIRVPDSTQREIGIDAETILGDWDPAEVKALLERGIFNDALYGLVRFRHREVRELLAAEWFRELLRYGNSRHATEELFFREQYGQQVIIPRLRPILPWLILFDDELRHRALEIAPEVAVEGGDAALLPFAERQALLDDIVRRVAKDEDSRSARDNSAIARIAQPDLSDDALRLIEEHRDNDDAIFFLGRLVWQGGMAACVPALSEIATDPKRGLFARIAATRAVFTCGVRNQKDYLWSQLSTASDALPRRLLAEMVENANADLASVNFLITSIDKLEAYERYETTGLNRALHGFIDRLSGRDTVDAPKPLIAIISGFNEYLQREPYIEHGECHVSEEFAWLLGPATHAVERLVSTRSPGAFSSDALSTMLKVAGSWLWRDNDFDEYKSYLHEIVPAWAELNDALFWGSVEEARGRLETKKAERLTDDWPVQWPGHYWSFSADRFGDVLGFVASRDFLDDKLVALSLAHRLFIQANKPDGWLRQLRLAVTGNSDLEERLDTLLNPTTSQSATEWKKKNALQEKERKKKEEERNRSRAEWIEHLRATPDVVRHPPGLKAGEFSKEQYLLLQELESASLRTSHKNGANWKALIPQFGEDVAQAYRDAAISHWRIFTPGLRSEGHDTSSTSYELIFAMAGLEIEANESDNFPAKLSKAEVRHALRYLVWELNGFPSCIEQIYRAYPELTLKAVLAQFHWEIAHTDADKQKHYIIHNIAYHAPWIHQHIAPTLIEWLEKNDLQNNEVLRYCIHILLNGDADSETISKLAQSKISNNTTNKQLAAWYALWIDVDAEAAIAAAEEWLSRLPSGEASKEAQLLITSLMGTRHSTSAGPSRGSFRNVRNLNSLYLLMHQHIRAEDDIDRAGKGVYSRELRDDAQDCRNALFNQLSEISGKEAYIALAHLAREHPVVKYRPWMMALAYRRAEEDADLEPWTAPQVRDYDQHQTRTPITHRQLFDLTTSRLTDLKVWIERGNDSPYQTWQKAEGETEVRNLVAGWLNVQSSGRYSCSQENELPNRQRPDIWMLSPQVTSPVPIELKVLDKGWSGQALCERLRNQLAGDYLREETAGCGVFLLVWQGRSDKRNWEINGKHVTLPELPAALGEYWETVSDDFPGVAAIKVILIDFTVRDAKSTN